VITIETTRYSAVVRAFVESFPAATAKLNRAPVHAGIDEWCTNSNLQGARDFSLMDGDEEVLGFHDDPKDMWASDKALALVNELAGKKVLRFIVTEPKPRGLFARIFSHRA
jgi:hypothetical protein